MPAPSARDRLDGLDVARGGAALLVLLEHGLHACVPGYYAFSHANVVVGQSAILVFFMISGFVVPMSLQEGRGGATFWVRRFFRLFPVYWLSIGLAFAYLWAGGPVALDVRLSDTGAWLANLVLLQRPLGRPDVWGVFWSLHFELALYVLCWGLFVLGVLHRIGPRTIAVLLVGFALAVTAKLLRTKNPTDDLYNWMIVLSALFGLISYRYFAGQLTRRTYYGLLGGLAATALAIWGVNHALYPAVATYAQLLRAGMIGLLGYGAFVGLLEARGRSMPVVACWLGRRSYPTYLLHPFVLLLLPSGWPAWLFMPCLVGGTLLLAELTHRLVERPGIALGRRLESRRRPAGAAPAVDALAAKRAA